MRPCFRVSVLHLTVFVFLIAPVLARTTFATSPDYIVTTSTGASIVPGTDDIGLHNDDFPLTTISLPFPVAFYDQVFNSAQVSSNGYLVFTSAATYGFCLPTVDANNLILPASRDMYTFDAGSGQGVFTSVSGTAPNRIFNIEWRTVYCCADGVPPFNNFEVRLYEGQRRIDFIYGANGGTNYNGIGVQRDTGSQSTVVSCSSLPDPGTQYTFTIPDTCVPPPPNMVAWWRGDGNADDSVGGHHGSLLGGTSFASGEVGQGFNFDGTGDYVSVPSPAGNFGTGDFTIDFWMQTTSSGDAREIINKRLCGVGNNHAFEVRMNPGGTIDVQLLRDEDPTGSFVDSAGVVNDGQFHHLAIVRDGDTLSLYIDGALDVATTHANVGATNIVSDFPLGIGGGGCAGPGGGPDGTKTFNGILDEIEIFDRALAAQEITDLYLAGSAGKCKCTPPPDNMISWWPGEGDGNDIQDGNTLAAGNGNGFGFGTGKVGSAFTFDGSQFATAGTPSNLAITTEHVTIDGWINPSVSPSGFTVLFGRVGSGIHDYALILDTDLTGVIRTGNGDPGFEHFVHTGYNPPLNTWTHVALTYDGTTITVYANGVAVAAESKTGGVSNSGGPFNIGGRVDCCLYTGAIDEVEVFGRTLSDSEIALIYNAGSAGKCRPCTPAPTGMIDWWPGDGNANDIQGGHNGTFQGNAGISVGKVGGAFSFDGTGDWVDVGDVDLPVTFTIDAWINPTSLTGGPFIVSKDDGGSGRSYYLQVFSGGALEGVVRNAAGDVTEYASTTSPVTTGSWQHIAMTYDGNAAAAGQRIKFYYNGAAIAAAVQGGQDAGGTPKDAANPTLIGTFNGGSNDFNGAIDEVELFNRVLDAGEISGIYDAGSGGKCKPPIPVERHLVNISSRASVGTGDNVAIGGFIISSDPPIRTNSAIAKTVLIRGLGPSLQVNGTPVPGRLEDPYLELHNGDGTLRTANDDWQDNQGLAIQATGLAPNDPKEAAILVTLDADNVYTAILSGLGSNPTGIGLIEVYDLEPTGNSHLANISTRGQVLTGDDVLIGGIIVQGGTPVRVMVRGLGPSLSVNGTPVPGRLADPILELHDDNGALIASNDDWGSSPDVGAITTSGLAPDNAKESAILFVPAPGLYTAIVSGGGATPTGIGMVEAYRLGPP